MVRGQVWESLTHLQVSSGGIEKISIFEDWEVVCEFWSLEGKRWGRNKGGGANREKGCA